MLDRLLDLAVHIQQIPAPTFQEGERAEFVRLSLLAEGLEQVTLDGSGNVHACLKGGGGGRARRLAPVVVSAHLDTVFPPGTDLTLQREPGRLFGPGIGDNAIAVAALFGLVWSLREQALQLPFDLWLCANVGEEGLGNLKGMKAIVERHGGQVQAYLVLEGLGLGHVYHRGLGVRRYRISVHTSGGHSWLDYGQPSAVHELARLATRLTRLEVPQEPRSALNIGVIAGGTSVNTIAADASLELDLRSESPQALALLAGRVEQVCQQPPRHGVEVKAEVIGERPAGAIPRTHPLVELCAACLRREGMEPGFAIGSTDANIPLSLGYPAVTLSLTTGGRAHTVHEYIDTEPLQKGMAVLLGVVKGLAQD